MPKANIFGDYQSIQRPQRVHLQRNKKKRYAIKCHINELGYRI